MADKYEPPQAMYWAAVTGHCSLWDSFIQSLYEGGREGSDTTLHRQLHCSSSQKIFTGTLPSNYLSRLTSSSIVKSHALSLIQQLLANYQSSHSIHLYPPESFTTANWIHLQLKLTHLHFNAILFHGSLCYYCTLLMSSILL